MLNDPRLDGLTRTAVVGKILGRAIVATLEWSGRTVVVVLVCRALGVDL